MAAEETQFSVRLSITGVLVDLFKDCSKLFDIEHAFNLYLIKMFGRIDVAL